MSHLFDWRTFYAAVEHCQRSTALAHRRSVPNRCMGWRWYRSQNGRSTAEHIETYLCTLRHRADQSLWPDRANGAGSAIRPGLVQRARRFIPTILRALMGLDRFERLRFGEERSPMASLPGLLGFNRPARRAERQPIEII